MKSQFSFLWMAKNTMLPSPWKKKEIVKRKIIGGVENTIEI
jgi:hypothetical protein